MTGEMMNHRAPMEKSADADLLCEVGGLTGAAHGEKSAERLVQCAGSCDRDRQTRAGTVELLIPKLRKGSGFPAMSAPLCPRREQATARHERRAQAGRELGGDS